MEKKEFYAKCAEIVGVGHEYDERQSIKYFDRETGEVYDTGKFNNRWGGRGGGNGRFPGVGLIRSFGSVIHISLNNPRFSGTYTSYEDALAALQEIFANETKEL